MHGSFEAGRGAHGDRPSGAGPKPALTAGSRASGSAGASDVRVLIVDDEGLFRAGLRAMLQAQGLHVIGEVSRSEDALELVARSAPDVVLLSLDLVGISATEATRRLTRASPRTRVVALTSGDNDGAVVDALIAGATGHLPKEETEEGTAAAIVRAAAAGDVALSGRTARAAVQRLRELSETRAAAERIRATLSHREAEVLRLLVDGKNNAEIGTALFISPMTVKHHVQAICRKLGAENRTQAAVRAVRAGIV